MSWNKPLPAKSLLHAVHEVINGARKPIYVMEGTRRSAVVVRTSRDPSESHLVTIKGCGDTRAALTINQLPSLGLKLERWQGRGSDVFVVSQVR